MIDENELKTLRELNRHNVEVGSERWFGNEEDILDTIEELWKIVRAGQEHVKTHGHTTDHALEDALIKAGLADPAQAAWRKGR